MEWGRGREWGCCWFCCTHSHTRDISNIIGSKKKESITTKSNQRAHQKLVGGRGRISTSIHKHTHVYIYTHVCMRVVGLQKNAVGCAVWFMNSPVHCSQCMYINRLTILESSIYICLYVCIINSRLLFRVQWLHSFDDVQVGGGGVWRVQDATRAMYWTQYNCDKITAYGVDCAAIICFSLKIFNNLSGVSHRAVYGIWWLWLRAKYPTLK